MIFRRCRHRLQLGDDLLNAQQFVPKKRLSAGRSAVGRAQLTRSPDDVDGRPAVVHRVGQFSGRRGPGVWMSGKQAAEVVSEVEPRWKGLHRR